MTPYTFDGDTYTASRDGDRLSRQYDAVYALMRDGRARTPAELEAALGQSWASISARLRDMRKPRFGGHDVVRAYQQDGVWTYRLVLAEPGTQARMF